MNLGKIVGASAALERFSNSNRRADNENSPVYVRPENSILKKAASSNYPSNRPNSENVGFRSPQNSFYAPRFPVNAPSNGNQSQQNSTGNSSQQKTVSFQSNNNHSNGNGIMIGGSQGSDPMDVKAICEYCRDIVIHQFYGDHIQYCAKNPQNKKVSCEYCGIAFPLDLIKTHLPNCHARVENIKIPCDFCKTPISLADQNYHESICQKNPRNKGRTAQVEECAICLINMNNNCQVRFLACAHKFHEGCIEDWSTRQKTCPVCLTGFE